MPGRDGIPSVTEILTPWADFSQVSPEVLDHAAKRGSKLHAYIAAHLLGEWIPSIEPEVSPYFDSFRRWADTLEAVYLVEQELTCGCYGYMGHVDVVGRIRGDEGATLADWKSPVAEQKTWVLQLAGYWHLVERHADLPVPLKRCGAIQCRPDGKPARMREYTGSMPQAQAAFLGVVGVHHFLKS